eukprot:5759783-Prymnesium_polylepis.1
MTASRCAGFMPPLSLTTRTPVLAMRCSSRSRNETNCRRPRGGRVVVTWSSRSGRVVVAWWSRGGRVVVTWSGRTWTWTWTWTWAWAWAWAWV